MSNVGDFITSEREAKYGTDVYLLDRYLAFLAAIENGEDEDTMEVFIGFVINQFGRQEGFEPKLITKMLYCRKYTIACLVFHWTISTLNCQGNSEVCHSDLSSSWQSRRKTRL